jgi:hypothetical protein
MKACVFLLTLNIATAQPVHELPFASANNTLELAVENTGSLNVSGVKVTALNVPSWLKFTSTEQTIEQLNSKQEKTTLFTFSVDRSPD